MGLIKGAVNLTRYWLAENPTEIGDDYVAERLQGNAFLDIEATTEEEAIGWVDALNPMTTRFEPQDFNFGQVMIFGLRLDTRRVSGKTLNRYLALAEMQARQTGDRPLSVEQRRQLKVKVRLDLLARTPVSTDVHEVCWFPDRREVWLTGAGTKAREKFEDLWRRTFGLGLIMKIPFILAREMLPADLDPRSLEEASPSALLAGGRREPA
ncbi:MAG: recombination-associated protein RdgC [Thermodesulfobacteriota bacterium]